MTEASFVDAYDGVVCDLDGVVYRGDAAVPGAPEALHAVVARGLGVVYATNNASRVPADVARQLEQLGAPGGPDDVVTSAQTGAAHLASKLAPGASVLALGGAGVTEALQRAGLRPVAPGADTACEAVLQGLGRQLTVADFEQAARVLADGTPWVATNDDASLPLPWGDAPGNGAYVELLAGAVGRRPEVVGKPHPPLYRLAVTRLGADPSRVLAVGDRLDTDVVGAAAAGVDSAWVLTGVGRPSQLLETDVRPTVVVLALDELLGTVARPEREGDVWVCGDARARLRGTTLDLTPSASRSDTLRAGLAAVVAGLENGEEPSRLAAAAAELDGLAAPSR